MSDGRTLNVLVLAVGGNVSQGILKALHRSSLSCRVIGADISPQQFGLYTTDASYVGPWAHAENFISWLEERCNKESVDVVLTGAEAVLSILSQQKDFLEQNTGTQVIVSSPGVEAICADKLRTCEWLRGAGLPSPRFAASEDVKALRQLAGDLGYPLIAKPRIGGGARGIFVVENEDDLAYAGRKSGYVIQEMLGTSDEEYTAGCFCDRNGAVCGTIVMRRELLAGTTYRAYVVDAPEVREAAEAITRALRPLGPCNIQMRMTERGPVCFEMNPRFSGTTPMRAHFGFNEVEAAIRHYVLGEDRVSLPMVTTGTCLRYWNELYVNPEAEAALVQDHTLPDPHALPSVLETYGAD